MIDSRIKLKQVLEIEKKMYLGTSFVSALKLCILHDHDYRIWKYVKYLRLTEYHFNTNHKIRYYFCQRKKNIMGEKLGITIWHNCVDEGLRIWHYGDIIINGHAKIGKNFQLHGGNCIGNKGTGFYEAPIIGDNVEIGVGAKVIGDIKIADNVVIGAGAVVIHDINEKGVIAVGIPAITKRAK